MTRRQIPEESIARFLTWKERYETDPSVSLRTIAADCGFSFTTARFKILEYGWQKAPDNKANIEQSIEAYRYRYCFEPELSALDIAKELNLKLYTVRYWIRKNNWQFCTKSKRSKHSIVLAREAKKRLHQEKLASQPVKVKPPIIRAKPVPTNFQRVSSIFQLADKLKSE